MTAVRSRGAAALLILLALLLLAPSAPAAKPGEGREGKRGEGSASKRSGAADRKRAGRGQQGGAPRLAARAWLLLDARSGEVLTSHAARRRLPIASATKMMTAYVALSRLDPRRVVRAAPYDAIYGESLLQLRPGQRVSVRDLLYGLILRSGNDSARDLALATAGSEKRFVRMMNAAAARLGLADSHFANPIGLDQEGNYSSAFDLAALGQVLLRNPLFARIAASRSAKLRSLRPPRRIETLNDFLRDAPWGTGIKTGHTFGAHYVLVGAGRRGGTELISAVIGTWTESERDAETIRLLDYGFSLYRSRNPVRRGQVLARPAIRFGDGRLALRAPRGVEVGVRRGERVRVRVVAPAEVEGPLRRGARLGRAVVSVEGRHIATLPLRAPRALPKPGLGDRLAHFVAENAVSTGLAAFAILGLVILLGRHLRRRSRRRWAMISREERFEERHRRRQERERSS